MPEMYEFKCEYTFLWLCDRFSTHHNIHTYTFHPGGIWPSRHRPGYVGHDRDT